MDRAAADDVSLTIQRGESIGFVGPTGAGKSTLVDLIVGLLPPSAGRLSVDGAELTARCGRRWRRRVGYVPQSIVLIDDSLRRNIALVIGGRLVDCGTFDELLARSAEFRRLAAGGDAGEAMADAATQRARGR